MKIKYTLLPLLMSALGLSSCNMLTPLRTVTPDPTSQVSSVDPTSGSSKESSESKQSSESSATSVSNNSDPTSISSATSASTASSATSASSASSATSVSTATSASSASSATSVSTATSASSSSTTSTEPIVEKYTVVIEFKDTDSGYLIDSSSKQFTKNVSTKADIFSFINNTVQDFEYEYHDYTLNKSGLPSTESGCILSERTYVVPVTEIPQGDVYNITYKSTITGTRTLKNGRSVVVTTDNSDDVTFTGPSVVAQGESIDFSASIAAGKTGVFGYWESSSSPVPISGKSQASYKLTEDATLTSHYFATTRQVGYLAAFASGGYSINTETSQANGFIGTDTEVTVVAYTKIRTASFKGWLDLSSGQIVSTSLSYTFTMPGRPLVLVAVGVLRTR